MTFERILATYVKTNKQVNEDITSLVKANIKNDFVRIVKNYFIESIPFEGVEKEVLLSAYDQVDFSKVILQGDIYKNFKPGDRVKLKYNPENPIQKQRERTKMSTQRGIGK